MKVVEIAPGVVMNLADDVTDEEVERLKSLHAPRHPERDVKTKDRAPTTTTGDVQTKSGSAPTKKRAPVKKTSARKK